MAHDVELGAKTTGKPVVHFASTSTIKVYKKPVKPLHEALRLHNRGGWKLGASGTGGTQA